MTTWRDRWPWPEDTDFNREHECPRCKGTIPARWRHFWPVCPCTYTPTDQSPHDPDPKCWRCDGDGYLACVLQDLSILRKWGACQTCGAWSFILIDTVGHATIEGSGRHADDMAGHEVLVGPVPLVSALGNYLDAARGEEPTP